MPISTIHSLEAGNTDYDIIIDVAKKTEQQSEEHIASFHRAINNTKITVTDQSEEILKDFYNMIKSSPSKQYQPLREFYQHLSWEDFLVRLAAGGRYSWFYGDGRFARPRKGEGEDANIRNLYQLGHTSDKTNRFTGYLTPLEMTVSHLVSLTLRDHVVGTGYRPRNNPTKAFWEADRERTMQEEVCIGYPVGVELRGGQSFGLIADGLGVIKQHWGRSQQLEAYMIEILGRDPYIEIMKKIYGDTWEGPKPTKKASFFERVIPSLLGRKEAPQRVIPHPMGWNPSEINFDAFEYRTCMALKSYIQSASENLNPELESHQKVLVVKGIGLGAFGLMSPKCQKNFIESFEKALKRAIEETPPEIMSKFNHVELTNHRFDGQRRAVSKLKKGEEPLYVMGEYVIADTKVLITHDLYPMAARASREIVLVGEPKTVETIGYLKSTVVGAICACGDAGSIHGNEIYHGVPASSSDDPATFRCVKNFIMVIKGLFHSKKVQANLAQRLGGNAIELCDKSTCRIIASAEYSDLAKEEYPAITRGGGAPAQPVAKPAEVLSLDAAELTAAQQGDGTVAKQTTSHRSIVVGSGFVGSLAVGLGLGFGVSGFTLAGSANAVLFSVGGLSVTAGLLSVVGVALIAGLCVAGLAYTVCNYAVNRKRNSFVSQKLGNDRMDSPDSLLAGGQAHTPSSNPAAHASAGTSAGTVNSSTPPRQKSGPG